jgi:alpha-mannosidase
MAHLAVERQIIARQISNRLDEIKATIFRNRVPISGWETVVTGCRQDVTPIPTDGWVPFEVGSTWGAYDVTQWFRAVVTIPKELSGKKVVLLVRHGFEGVCYLNGVPTQGLDSNRDEIVLAEEAAGGETYQIEIEAYAGSRPNISYSHTFEYAALATRDDLAWSFYWDLRVALDVVENLPADSASRVRLLNLIDKTIKQIDLNEVEDIAEYTEQITTAQTTFRKKLAAFQHTQGIGALALIGHSHIDTAWLWTLAETRRKCARTFSTVLKYMDEYPEYKFSQSQPQLYEYVRDYYPVLWEKIKERVKEGRWEVMGGGWVEQDSNVAGAEALVRQYLYGNRFFRDEFGIHTRAVWLPDAFGYPIQLPQIIKKAQIDSFNTTKIGWNQYNELAYSMFMWRGLDGSEVLGVMHPCGRRGYNGAVTPADLTEQWSKFKQKDVADEVWYPFGFGDGGGGATKEDLEHALRLSQDMVGVPKVNFSTLQEYFDRLDAQLDKSDLPVFNDELYFELHRGCQTTQARTKRNNRKCELALRDAELIGAAATRVGHEYPSDALLSAWKPLLTNQFHDILPGSSITEVYEDADKHYAEILTTANAARDASLDAVASHVDTSGKGTPVVVTNTLGWIRDDAAEVVVTPSQGQTMLDPAGQPVPCQAVTNADGKVSVLFEAQEVPSAGYAVYRLADGKPATVKASDLKATDSKLENRFLAVYFAKNGTIKRIYDKANGREVLPKGAAANDLQLFDDRPHKFEAWDIDFNIDDVRWSINDVVSMSVTETGPVRATIRIVKKAKHSTITQDVSIFRNNPRIDFRTSVEWHEKRRLLKAAFPVDVLSRVATYEVQYGAIERPTHHSSTVDRAKFEVPGHRWIDLSEGDYGVSLLNDSKYGFDVYQNRMRISLLRSTTEPDPHADEGHHDFTYSLYPHAGDWREGGTVRAAYELNAPMIARTAEAHEGDLPCEYGFVSVDRSNVVIDSVKKAEDSDAIIVRMYEAHGARGTTALSFAETPSSVSECDLMEENDEPVEVVGAGISFAIAPWEIKTFKIQF